MKPASAACRSDAVPKSYVPSVKKIKKKTLNERKKKRKNYYYYYGHFVP